MKIKAANGVARILKTEGVPWVSCYPTSHVNNALGEEGVRILMMGEERFAVGVADAFSRVRNSASGVNFQARARATRSAAPAASLAHAGRRRCFFTAKRKRLRRRSS